MVPGVLTLLLGLTLSMPPMAIRPDGTPRKGLDMSEDKPIIDTRPDVVEFDGKQARVTLRATRHQVKLRSVLLDLEVGRGWHTLTEGNPLKLPGPLLLVECSAVNELDGDVLVLGAAGLKVKGPKIYSVFSIEPFVTRFPGGRLRMVKDNGTAIFSANTVDVLQVPEDYRYAQIVGLDPTAKYRVKVSGKPGLVQVLVAADRDLQPSQDGEPADAAWTAGRMVLKGGGKAELPATRRIALTLAGVRGLIPEKNSEWERTIDVTVELVKAGSGDPNPLPKPEGTPNRAGEFLLTVSRQLLQKQQPDAARPLLEQCVTQDPKNAECHYLYAQVWQLFGDKRTMKKHACLAIAHGAGDLITEKSRELLGGEVCR